MTRLSRECHAATVNVVAVLVTKFNLNYWIADDFSDMCKIKLYVDEITIRLFCKQKHMRNVLHAFNAFYLYHIYV